MTICQLALHSAVVANAVVAVVACLGGRLRAGGIGDGGSGRTRQRPVRALLVVVLDEGVEERLELADGGRLDLGEEPPLQGLMEALQL